MSKYRIQVHIDDYWDYVVEAKNEEEAQERAHVDFRETVANLQPTVEVGEVPDDSPLGDV